jgi:putative ABC transport system substrate-binding protein
MDRRRWLAVGLAVGATPLRVLAQPGRAPRRIGFLGFAQPALDTDLWLIPFRAGMKELGWVEGRDYVLDARHASGDAIAFPGLAEALVASRPDAILTPGDGAAVVLARSTKTIPIVFIFAQDAVGNGLVASLPQPGGNLTGLSSMTTELWGKRLQLLKTALPRLAHIGCLYSPDDVAGPPQAREVEASGRRVDLRVTSIELRRPDEVDAALGRAAAAGAGAIVVSGDRVTYTHREPIVASIQRLKLPSMFVAEVFAQAGGLMAYSASPQDNARRAAGYVSRILKGAAPGSLAIAQPTKFEFVLNRRTAQAIGVRLPETLLRQADRVIG